MPFYHKDILIVFELFMYLFCLYKEHKMIYKTYTTDVS